MIYFKDRIFILCVILEFSRGGYFSIQQINDPGSVLCIFFGMCYLYYCYAIFLVQLAEQRHNLLPLFRVEVTCWLIGQDQLRPSDQCACNA